MRNGIATYTNRLDAIAHRFWNLGQDRFQNAKSQTLRERLYVLYNDARISGCAQLMTSDAYDTFDRFDREVHGET
jgi:hypothetical protein